MLEAQPRGLEGDEDGGWPPEETTAGGEASPKAVDGVQVRLPEGVGRSHDKTKAQASVGAGTCIVKLSRETGQGLSASPIRYINPLH